jgi:hypothetical protein
MDIVTILTKTSLMYLQNTTILKAWLDLDLIVDSTFPEVELPIAEAWLALSQLLPHSYTQDPENKNVHEDRKQDLQALLKVTPKET